MKLFTKKFFLLAIGMILSVGASAGEPVVYHRFPEVKFTYDNQEWIIEAWDWQFGGTNQGYLRGQKIELTNAAENRYTGRLVSRMPLNETRTSTKWNVFQDQTITYKGRSIKVSQFTYADVIPDGYEGRENELEEGECLMDLYRKEHGIGPNGEEIYGTASYSAFPVIRSAPSSTGTMSSDNIVTGNYTVPTYYEHDMMGKIDVIEIGPYAYRNSSWDTHRLDWFKPTTITVPKEIQKIETGGLSVNISNGTSATSESYVKKITFEAGSPITEIPMYAFMTCHGLEEINIPAGVTTIGAGALGGCKNLKKIVFEGETPPALLTHDTGNTNYGDNGVIDFVTVSGSSYNIGQKAKYLKPDYAKCVIEVPLGSALSYTQKDDTYKKFPMMSKFTLNKEIISYCSDLPFTFKQYNTSNKTWSDGDVNVYYVHPDNVDVEGRRIEFTKIEDTKKIPTETDNTETGYFGVLLKGTAGETYNIFYPNNVLNEEVTVENCLEGVITDTEITINNQYLYYVLSNGSFLPVTQPGTLAANKAFIMFEPNEHMNINNARELALYFPGETTGISNYDVQSLQNDAFYTLQGIRVKNPEKGVFIKNGKKIIIK